MELQDYVRIVRKNWILILILTVLGGAAGWGGTALTPNKYDSTSQLYVSVRAGSDTATGELLQGTNYARQSVISYVDVATSALVLDRVIEELGLEKTAAEVTRQLSVTSPSDTVLVEITATDTDPEQAAALANVTGEVFADVIENEIEITESDGSSRVQIKMIDPAIPAELPSSPNLRMNVALGVLLGLVLGLGLAVLRNVLDTRIQSIGDIKQVTSAPVIGGIAFDSDFKKQPLVVQSAPRSPIAESYRTLRTNVQFLDADSDSDSQIFVVSSAAPSEGKSTTAANLAIALAQTGYSVALVDADLRKPRIAIYMGIEGGVGLTDVLIGKAELTDALQPWGRGRLAVLPAGRIPPNPSELLGSRSMQEVLSTLGQNVDYVIVDAPPLLAVTDAAVVARFSSGIILTVAAKQTRKDDLAGAIDAISAADARLLGLVATMLPTKGPDSDAYGAYSYGEHYREYGDALPPASAPGRQPKARKPDGQDPVVASDSLLDN